MIRLLPALAGIALMAWYRAEFLETRVCAAAAAPWGCLARAPLLWLQYEYGFGALALVAGLLAFARRAAWLGVGAVLLGGIAVENYNATWGMVGAALGFWALLGAGGRQPA